MSAAQANVEGLFPLAERLASILITTHTTVESAASIVEMASHVWVASAKKAVLPAVPICFIVTAVASIHDAIARTAVDAATHVLKT